MPGVTHSHVLGGSLLLDAGMYFVRGRYIGQLGVSGPMAPLIYNRRAAVDYARKWALHYNADWPSHAGVAGGGGDCTNFISQALYAGGWPMEDISLKSRGWFSYSNEPGTSHSWAGAQPFSIYLRSSGRARRCRRYELDLGDIVQLAAHGHVHHTVMVTKVEPEMMLDVPAVLQDAPIDGSTVCRPSPGPVPAGKLFFVSSHSSDRLDYPLTEWEQLSVYDERIYWKINDVIPPMPRPSWRSQLVRSNAQW